ncbi:MAG: hypothetical protein GF310_10380 [candidate division Zixibacteria bacterium]|nr:hypothetical protein [candidate division Zixibacteria bacterium]
MFKSAKFIASALLLLIISFIVFCAPAEKEPSEYAPEGLVAPSDLALETNNESMKLSWRTNRTEDMIISGYNIYISTQPLIDPSNPNRIKKGIEPFNPVTYPGDADPQIKYETYEASGLENGVEYHVAVTTVYPDRIESPPSNIVTATCYPQGTVTIKDRSVGDPDGFSFSKQEYAAYNSLDNDLYFIARDIGNMIGSPDRNDGVLKHTLFAELKMENELTSRHDYKNLNFKDRSFVAEGNVYLLELSDGSRAKIRIKQVDSSAFKKQVIFDYIYFGQ